MKFGVMGNCVKAYLKQDIRKFTPFSGIYIINKIKIVFYFGCLSLEEKYS